MAGPGARRDRCGVGGIGVQPDGVALPHQQIRERRGAIDGDGEFARSVMVVASGAGEAHRRAGVDDQLRRQIRGLAVLARVEPIRPCEQLPVHVLEVVARTIVPVLAELGAVAMERAAMRTGAQAVDDRCGPRPRDRRPSASSAGVSTETARAGMVNYAAVSHTPATPATAARGVPPLDLDQRRGSRPPAQDRAAARLHRPGRSVVDQVLLVFLAGGHCLLRGVPGPGQDAAHQEPRAGRAISRSTASSSRPT